MDVFMLFCTDMAGSYLAPTELLMIGDSETPGSTHLKARLPGATIVGAATQLIGA